MERCTFYSCPACSEKNGGYCKKHVKSYYRFEPISDNKRFASIAADNKGHADFSISHPQRLV
jgi:hypothetical protein